MINYNETMIQALWLTTGMLGIVVTRGWDSEGLYLFLLALFFPWGFRGLPSLAVCIYSVFFYYQYLHILFQDGAVGRVLT